MPKQTPSVVRLGLIGLGSMGRNHAETILKGAHPRLALAAVVDADPARLATFPATIAKYTDPAALFRSDTVDAVLIATPHPSHPELSIAALRAGLHVLVEKPIAIHKREAARMISVHRKRSSLVFAAMFNQRTSGYYQAIHQLIHSGQLGGLQRMQWTITNWFRTQAYYASSGWRATWRGEGGGVLLNQSPHQLDLLCWMFGLPQQVRAFCHFGKYHPIEVEDEVTAYLEFPNGATGVFITSTGEAPGSNRLEIVGDLGRVVFEGDRLQFTRNTIGTAEFSKTSSNGFAAPPTEEVQLVADGHGRQHAGILQYFTEAILDGTPLLAPAEEGIQSVELANAMLLSSWLNRTIELPMNGQMFEYHLRRRMNESSSKDKRRSGRTKRAPRR